MSKFYTNYSSIGENLYIRGYENGEFFTEKLPIEPTFYITNTKKDDSPYTSIYGESLKPVSFTSRRESRKFVDQYKGTNLTVCGNANFGNQHIIENPSLAKYEKEHISTTFFDIEVYSTDGSFPEAHEAKHPVVSITLYESKTKNIVILGSGPNRWSKENSQIDSYFAKNSKDLKDRASRESNPKKKKDFLEKAHLLDRKWKKEITYIHCENEVDLLNKFLLVIKRLNTDILSGWNSDKFDMVYIYTRMQNLGMKPNRLSPWDRASIREFNTAWGVEYTVNVAGISNIDYMNMYKKFERPQATYKLDYIAKKELRVPKLEYEGTLFELFDNDYQKFIDYNVVDVLLLVLMEEKKELFDNVFGVAYRTKSTFDDTFGTIKVWENLMADDMWSRNQIPPCQRPEKYTGETIPGGFVKDPEPSRYGWVMSFDYASLYPSLIRTYNISPETLVSKYALSPAPATVENMLSGNLNTDFLKSNETLCASGYVYRTDEEGILARLMRQLYEERVEMKKSMKRAKDEGDKRSQNYYNTQQMTAKTLLNSGYGALAANSFLYFDNRLASSITLAGQLSIKWGEMALNEYMNRICKTQDEDYVIAIDTDSCYVDMQKFVDLYASGESNDKICDILDQFSEKKMQPYIKSRLEDLKAYTNSEENVLEFERENIASVAIWIRKKRYCMLVHDSEGYRYETPDVKIQGLEAIKSSTPEIARLAMWDPEKEDGFLRMVMGEHTKETEERCQKFISDLKDRFVKADPLEISFPRIIRGISKYKDLRDPSWSASGTPVQTHGAIVYNECLKMMNLDKKYEMVKDNNRAFYAYVKKPNLCNNTHVITFNEWPKEMELKIDMEAQFDKAFLKAVDPLMKISGWISEKKASLFGSGLFG